MPDLRNFCASWQPCKAEPLWSPDDHCVCGRPECRAAHGLHHPGGEAEADEGAAVGDRTQLAEDHAAGGGQQQAAAEGSPGSREIDSPTKHMESISSLDAAPLVIALEEL